MPHIMDEAVKALSNKLVARTLLDGMITQAMQCW